MGATFARLMLGLALALASSACGELKQKARTVDMRMGDPRAVVAATCPVAASPMCACIVEETVKTMQAGPRAITALFEKPDAVWRDVLKSLDPKARDLAVNIRAAAESNCKRRYLYEPEWEVEIDERTKRVEARARPAESLLASCITQGNTRDACNCYEETLKGALSQDAFEQLKVDARFPPPLKKLAANRRRTALATIASARSVCGVG